MPKITKNRRKKLDKNQHNNRYHAAHYLQLKINFTSSNWSNKSINVSLHFISYAIANLKKKKNQQTSAIQ